jgi:cob(I)alamin adenosyltransferase
MKIYTKKGDTGETSLFGGSRISKHDIRIDAYGSVDELNSHIGLIRDLLNEAEIKDSLKTIQSFLFVIGASLATDPTKKNIKTPSLEDSEIEYLELLIDKYEDTLPEMKSFILPGGTTTSSQCHIARTICRRAERATTHLSSISTINPIVISYLNRLSDYLFVLARKVCLEEGGEEIPWIPKK